MRRQDQQDHICDLYILGSRDHESPLKLFAHIKIVRDSNSITIMYAHVDSTMMHPSIQEIIDQGIQHYTLTMAKVLSPTGMGAVLAVPSRISEFPA